MQERPEPDLSFPLKRLILTLILCGMVYLPSLFWTLGLDQNIFAEIGSLLLNGRRLYVDAWDVKPPNIFYTYAFFEAIFGQSEFAIRFSDFCSTLFACAAIFAAVFSRLRTRTSSPFLLFWAPIASSLLLCLTLFSLGLSDTAQSESYALGFILIAPYLAFRERLWKVAACGGCIAIAAFYKSTNAIFLLPILIEVFLIKRSREFAVRNSLTILAGFIAVSLIQLGVLALQGSLAAYLRITLAVFREHPREISSLHFLDLLRALWVSVDFWLLLVIAAVVCSLLRSDRGLLKTIRLPLLYLAAGLAAVYVQNKGWGYHYIITHPGLISTCAICTVYLIDKLHNVSIKLAWSAVAAVLVLTFIISPSARRRLHYTSGAIASIHDHSTYLSTLGARQSLYYPPCTIELANYLASHSQSSDSIFILGEEPGAYWRSNRPPATPYTYSLLFTSGVIPSADLVGICSQLAKQPPILIAIERYDTTAFRGRPVTSESLLNTDSSFTGLRSLLANSYTFSDTVCGKFLIYRRH